MDQPKIDYLANKVPGPFNAKGAFRQLWEEVETLKKESLVDILHLSVGEVIDIKSEGVDDSADVITVFGTAKKISLKSAVYRVHKFDGNVIEKVFFNGSLSMQDPPIVGSLVLFQKVGNDYYIIKTLTTKRRVIPSESEDNTDVNNPEFLDIDRDLEPGQVRITEAQEGASIFLGNGNIRLVTPSQTNYISLINETGQIGMVANDIIGAFDDSFDISTFNVDSTVLLEKITGTPLSDAQIFIDDQSQLLFQNYFNSVKLNTTKFEILKRQTPNSSITIDEVGKIVLRSNVTVDPETEDPIDGTELSSVTIDENGVAATNSAKFNITLDLNQVLIAGINSMVKQDILGNVNLTGLTTALASTGATSISGATVSISGSTITLAGAITLAGPNPVMTSAGPLNLTAPTISLNFGTKPIARVGDTVTGTISGLASDPISGPIPVIGTFIGIISGPGNATVLA